MSDIKIEVVGKISRVDVRPDDMFVLHMQDHISKQTADQITRWWDEKWGPDAPKLFIISAGAHLGVLHREVE